MAVTSPIGPQIWLFYSRWQNMKQKRSDVQVTKVFGRDDRSDNLSSNEGGLQLSHDL